LIARSFGGDMGKGGAVVSSLAVLGLGAFAARKFLPTHSIGIVGGMATSAAVCAIRDLAPDLAATIGVSGIESVSTRGRYLPAAGAYYRSGPGKFYTASAGLGDYYQAAAGQFVEAAAGGTGEYYSQDLHPTGQMGEYYMSQLQVQGDTGAYELYPQVSGTDGPIYDGVDPGGDLDDQFNFMEAAAGSNFMQAAAGVQARSTYLPTGPSRGITRTQSTQPDGIFDDVGNGILG